VPKNLRPDPNSGGSAPPASATGPTPVQRDRSAAPTATQSPAPWIVGGIGAASLAAAGVFYLLRNSAASELDRECLGRTCPDTVESTQSRGQTYSLLSGVTLGAGALGVGVATVMLLTRSKTEFREKRIIKEKLNDIAGLHTVDVIFINEVDKGFRDIILETGKIIYEK